MEALAGLMKRRKAALWSPVDIQKILPTGDRCLIEDGARRMYELFGGDLICKNYPDLRGHRREAGVGQVGLPSDLPNAGVAA